MARPMQFDEDEEQPAKSLEEADAAAPSALTMDIEDDDEEHMRSTSVYSLGEDQIELDEVNKHPCMVR